MIVDAVIVDEPQDAIKNILISKLDNGIFAEDHRKTKPGLHLFYTKNAVIHLMEIEKTIKTFCDFADFNMLNIVDVLIQARQQLIDNKAAYAEANDILDSIRHYLPIEDD